MDRKLLIAELKTYFDIRELVCEHTYNAFSDKSWQFFDHDALEMLLVLRRDIVQAPMLINNWHTGGQFSQRGFRCNICQLVKDKTVKGKIYLTSHANGAAFDFDAKGMTSEQVRQLVKSKAALLPCNVRMEDGVSWCHIDIYDNGFKFSLFNAA